MRKTIFKESAVYVFLFLISAVAMHPDLFSEPLERLLLMSQRQNYIHPFVYALLIYLFIGMFRLFIKAVSTVFKIGNKR